MVSSENVRDVGYADIIVKTVNSRKFKPESSCFRSGIYSSFSGATLLLSFRSVIQVVI